MGQQSLQCCQPPSQSEMCYQARPQYSIWMCFLIYCNSDGWNPSPLYWSGSEEMSWPRKNPGHGAALSGMVLQRTLVGIFWLFKLTLFYCKHYLSVFAKNLAVAQLNSHLLCALTKSGPGYSGWQSKTCVLSVLCRSVSRDFFPYALAYGKPVTVPATSWVRYLIVSALCWPGCILCFAGCAAWQDFCQPVLTTLLCLLHRMWCLSSWITVSCCSACKSGLAGLFPRADPSTTGSPQCCFLWHHMV